VGPAKYYSTEASTFTITQILTTTDANSQEYTITTTITSITMPFIPPKTTTGAAELIFKINSPAAVNSTTTPQLSSGPSSTQPGGTIGVAVSILVILLIATLFIIRRLNKAIIVTKPKLRRCSTTKR